MYVQAFDCIMDPLCSDMLLIFPYSNLKSVLHMSTHTNVSWCMQTHLLTLTPFKCCPSQTDLALLCFELTLFPVQMTASTWEMSGCLCQLCLASSNICEVLSSSLQLRRAVSLDSRLLTHKAAKTVVPSALKHIHFVRSFASTKDCIPSKFVVFKAVLSPCCEGSCIT